MASGIPGGARELGSDIGPSIVREELAQVDNKGAAGLEAPWANGKKEYQVHAAKRTSKNARQKELSGDESIVGALCTWIVDHQIGIAINHLLLLGLTHLCFPRARRHTVKFFTLSYYDERSGRYGLGWDDIFLVFHCILVFTGLRIFVMEYVMAPFAEKVGIGKKKDKVRFAEQAWVYVYYGAFWSLGMYIMYNSDYWLKLENMWAGWPDREMDGLRKWYYLVQFAFWLQQILVVNIEERRKDHFQMLTHHLVTCALMLTSYGYHHTKIGNVILVIMDSVDTIFPLAKMLKYMKYQTACDIAFGVFVVLWFFSRHIAYGMVVYSIYADLPKHIQFGCYSGSNDNMKGPFPAPDNLSYLVAPFFDPEGLVCQTETMQSIFVGMLLFLQCILLMWFAMIIRVVLRVIQGKDADDPRSGDEADDDNDEEVDEANMKQQLRDYIEVPPSEGEEDVEAGSMSTAGGVGGGGGGGRMSSPARRYKRATGSASGVSLQHNKKALLGRIGCDKGV